MQAGVHFLLGDYSVYATGLDFILALCACTKHGAAGHLSRQMRQRPYQSMAMALVEDQWLFTVVDRTMEVRPPQL